MGQDLILVWLAGIISSDGHVSAWANSPGIQITVGSNERDWAIHIKQVVETKTPLNIKIHGPYTRHGYQLLVTPTRTFYEIMRPYKKYMMPRKWERLEYYFSNFRQDPIHLAAFKMATRLVNNGHSVREAARRAAKKHKLREGLIKAWLYENREPRYYAPKNWRSVFLAIK